MQKTTEKISCMFLGLFLCLQPLQGISEPATYGLHSRIVKHSNIALSKNQREKFKIWKSQATYFGAFAIAKDGSYGIGVMQVSGLKTAQKIALIECRKRETARARDCTLYASSLPRKMSSGTDDAIGLSEACLRWFNTRYRRKHLKEGKFCAFAWTRIGKCSLSCNADSEKEAIERAVKACNGFVAKSISNLSKASRKEIRRRKLDKCEVVHVKGSK